MTAQTGTSGMTEQVRERASEGFEEARSRGREAVEGQVDARSTQAGESLSGVADQAHGVSDTLRDQGNDTAARVVEQVAAYTDRLADYLRSSSATTIIEDVEHYARKQPWAVAIGGTVLGFAAARLLRASRSNSHAGNGYRGLSDHSRDLDDLGGRRTTGIATGYGEGYGTGYTGEGGGYGTGYGSGYGTVAGGGVSADPVTGEATGYDESLRRADDPLAPTTPATVDPVDDPGTGYGRGNL